MKQIARLSALVMALVLHCTVTTPSLHPGDTLFGGGQAAADATALPTAHPTALEQDVEALCDLVEERYAYYASRRSVWKAACATARAEAARPGAETQSAHLAILERLLDQLYDNHISLNTHSAASPRLVPSGSDLWLDYAGGKVTVTAVRPGSAAAAAGVRVGDVVTHLNGEPVLATAMHRIKAGRKHVSKARLDWALNAQAAGYHGAGRSVGLRRGGEVIELELDPVREASANISPVTARRLPGNVGYIRIEDSLGRDGTVEAFDAALDDLRGAKGWIIDLRNTPGGGSTDVAEPILGRFIRGVKPYQRSGPRWQGEAKRYAASRGPWRVRGRVAVLAGRWTGSMGEGMAVGFDGLRRARVFGSPMARLAGGIESFELPGSGMSVRFPTYNLQHIRGTDRHRWTPPHAVTADNGDGPDLALQAALEWLN